MLELSEAQLSACVELACNMNNDPSVYDAFQNAMGSGPDAFAKWLSDHGIPAELAGKLSTQTGEQLAQTIGEVLCDRFW